MAVLETAIVFENTTLVERAFCDTTEILDKQARANMLTAISILLNSEFAEDLESLSIGEHQLIAITRMITKPNAPIKPYENDNNKIIKMYALIDTTTHQKTVKKCMNKALDVFTKRYPLSFIFLKKVNRFESFSEKLGDIFKNTCVKSTYDYQIIQ